MGDDFVVESKGHCFICLSQSSVVKLERGSPPTYSLLSLSRYLKLDLKKAFNEMEAIPQQLVDKVMKSTLKVELCQECATLIKKFSRLYRQLEKIDMELATSVNNVHGKLLNAEGIIKRDDFRKADLDTGWEGKVGVLENLRTEAIQKCSVKLTARDATPRLPVKNLSMTEVNVEKLRLRANRHREVVGQLQSSSEPMPDPDIQIQMSTNIKDEHPIQTPALMDDVDDNNYFSDDAEAYNMEQDEGPSLVTVTPTGPSSPTKVDYHLHRSFNPTTSKYKGRHCSAEFTKTQNCVRHYKSAHLNVKFQCALCGNKFKYDASLKTHHNTVHIGMRFICVVCGRQFSQRGHFSRHKCQLSKE